MPKSILLVRWSDFLARVDRMVCAHYKVSDMVSSKHLAQCRIEQMRHTFKFIGLEDIAQKLWAVLLLVQFFPKIQSKFYGSIHLQLEDS